MPTINSSNCGVGIGRLVQHHREPRCGTLCLFKSLIKMLSFVHRHQ